MPLPPQDRYSRWEMALQLDIMKICINQGYFEISAPRLSSVLVHLITTWLVVSCGTNQFAVYTEDGRVYTFGDGKYAQPGHGDKENRTYPALVHALEGKYITQVQCD